VKAILADRARYIKQRLAAASVAWQALEKSPAAGIVNPA